MNEAMMHHLLWFSQRRMNLIRGVLAVFLAITAEMRSSLYAAEMLFPVEGSQKNIHLLYSALTECPALSDVLKTLHAQGKFSAIRVVPEEVTRKQGPFHAVVVETDIWVTPEWISAQSELAYDVRETGEISPSNLCFGIGHLADHLAHPEALDVRRYSSRESYLDARFAAEAHAFIVGWNVAMNAAIAKNHGITLDPKQSGKFILDFQYRHILMEAMSLPNGQNLLFLPSGLLSEDSRTVNSLVSAMQSSMMPDIE